VLIGVRIHGWLHQCFGNNDIDQMLRSIGGQSVMQRSTKIEIAARLQKLLRVCKNCCAFAKIAGRL
jgi:hypothetical protein